MCVFEVVGAGIALIEIIEEVVVDRGLSNEVFCPSNTEGFVVVSKNIIGYCQIVCILSWVDESISRLFEETCKVQLDGFPVSICPSYNDQSKHLKQCPE